MDKASYCPVAEGMDRPCSSRAPVDLLTRNPAGPDELAPPSEALAPGGTVSAPMLDTQADAVASAYQALGLNLRHRGAENGRSCANVGRA